MSNTKTRKGIMLILSSPSGAGKSTLAQALLALDTNTKRSISVTTRLPRPGEIDGEDYIFITKQNYDALSKAGELIEHAEVFGHYYGTLKEQTEKAIKRGIDMVYVIDWQGAVQLLKNYRDDIVSIFILPPSIGVLEQRLRRRGTDSNSTIEKRLAGAKLEISKQSLYDNVVVNNDMNQALQEIKTILDKARHAR